MNHLDDDNLSAVLDGIAPGDDHLSTCAQCQARLDALRGAARAVGEPVPALPGRMRDEMIAAALAAADEAPSPSVVPISGRRRGLAVWLPAAAAIVVALAIAVPLLRGGNSGRHAATSAAAPPATSAPEVSNGRASTASPTAAVVPGMYLGDQTDTAALAAAASSDLARTATPGAAASGAQAPAAKAAPESSSSQSDSLSQFSQTTKCDAAATAAARASGDAAALVYRTTARWRGTPATVAGFRLPDGSLTFVAVAEDCRVLVVARG